MPFDRYGSRVGWLVTANRLSHPKIPNYPLANLPRDPGTTYAFNAGVGIANEWGPASFGIDFVYEPMWSETWADAAADTMTARGTMIPAGGKTVENRFRFANFRLKGGGSHDFRIAFDSSVAVRAQLGFALYSNRYHLSQRNNIQGTARAQTTGWTEWGPAFGLAIRTRAIEVGYTLQLSCSPGACALPAGGDDVPVSGPAPGTGGVIAAPSGDVGGGLDYGRVLSHRLSISIPLR